MDSDVLYPHSSFQPHFRPASKRAMDYPISNNLDTSCVHPAYLAATVSRGFGLSLSLYVRYVVVV